MFKFLKKKSPQVISNKYDYDLITWEVIHSIEKVLGFIPEPNYQIREPYLEEIVHIINIDLENKKMPQIFHPGRAIASDLVALVEKAYDGVSQIPTQAPAPFMPVYNPPHSICASGMCTPNFLTHKTDTPVLIDDTHIAIICNPHDPNAPKELVEPKIRHVYD